MTSLKRPLEMELLLQNRASPTTLNHLNSANNMHKRRCTNTFNQNIGPYMATNHHQNHPSTSNSDPTNLNNMNNDLTNSNASDSRNQQQNNQHDQHVQHQHHHQQQHQQDHHNQHHQQSGHRHEQLNQQNQNLNGSPFKDSSTLSLAPINDDLSRIIHEELSQPARNETPVLSLRQTQIICDRLIQLRERKLREEYDKILFSKLTEQHDVFVKYTHDHIEQQFNSTKHQPSYLS